MPPIDFDQVVNLLHSSVKLWNILVSIQEEFNQMSGGSPPGGKQAPFIQKFSECLKIAEDFMDKQLQTFEQRLDKLDKSSVTPSVMDEVSRNLNQLHCFYALACGVSQSMIFMSVDSLLYPLRPFTNLARRLKSEKGSSQALTFSLRLYCKLLSIAKTTIIGRSAKNFIDKILQNLKECVETLLANASTKVSELMTKQKAELRKDILKLSLDPSPASPIYYLFSSLKNIKDPQLKESFVEGFIHHVGLVGKKMIAGQEDAVSGILSEARRTIREYMGLNSEEN